MSRAILPGATIGMLGSGQLGRMFAIAARRLGYRIHVFSPDNDSPTGQVSDLEIQANYDDLDAVAEFAKNVDVVSFEFENVQLEFKEEAILEIAKKAISKKTGARGLRSILENILLKTMFELPDMDDVLKVTVDKNSVKGVSEPIVTYGKKTSTSVA